MKIQVKLGYLSMALVLCGCMTEDLYSAGAGGAAVLVHPERAWDKPGSTMEDENRARKACGEELRANVELRKKGISDERDAAARACMNRHGFYKRR